MPSFDAVEFVPDGVPPGLPLVAAIVLLALVPALAVALLWLRTKRLGRRQAQEAASLEARAAEPLAPGRRVVRGRVEGEPEADPVASVRVVLERRTSKDAWRVRSRTSAARPFVLVRPEGERIRVDADDEAGILAELSDPGQSALSARVCVAEIRGGQELFVEGLAEQGNEVGRGGTYRSGEAWVVRGPMVLRTAFALRRYDRSLAGMRQRVVFGAVVMALVALPLVPFAVASVFGQSEVATVVDARVDGRNRRAVDVVRVECGDGSILEQDVSESVYRWARAALDEERSVRVPVVTTRAAKGPGGSLRFASFIGPRATVPDWWPPIAALPALLVLFLTMTAVLFGVREPWWDTAPGGD